MPVMTITLSLDDDAMRSSPDPKHEILGMLARSALSDGDAIYDYNGNKIGEVRVTPDPEPYYEWEDIPLEYGWAAFDDIGMAFAYERKPEWSRVQGTWEGGGDFEFIGPYAEQNGTPPEKSLRKRPQ